MRRCGPGIVDEEPACVGVGTHQDGGNYVGTDLPQAVSSATYNAANQLTQWGTSSLTYDANGNLTSDGVTTYTWNARNQLASLGNAQVTASFRYDAFGRRVGKTVNGVATDYLFDGANPVQELSGGAPTANLLTGLGVDEYLTRTDATGTHTFLEVLVTRRRNVRKTPGYVCLGIVAIRLHSLTLSTLFVGHERGKPCKRRKKPSRCC